MLMFSMSSMGFNSMACLQSASGMNTSSIIPSVSSISSPLSTSYPSPTSASAHSHYPMYKDSGYPGMTSSIASLRLKAKQHQSGFTSYSPQPPLSPRSSSLSACQYTGGVPDRTLLWLARRQHRKWSLIGQGLPPPAPPSGTTLGRMGAWIYWLVSDPGISISN